MSESKRLTAKQLAVIEDLFTGDLEESEIIEKHKIGRAQYDRWLADERFVQHLQRRIVHTRLQSQILLARCAMTAAAKLVQLTNCEKEETARKACLDIIAMNTDGGPSTDADATRPIPTVANLSPKTAGRLLAALAEDRTDRAEDAAPSL